MVSRYSRARLDPSDPKIVIRARYMEAIRAGAAIEEATNYANGDPATVPVFTKSAPVEQSAPRQGYGAPGEEKQMLPRGWAAGDVPPPIQATDPDSESVKRPAIESSATPAPVSKPAAVSAPVETKATAETLNTMPANWDQMEFEWPKLRALCMAMGLPSPNGRTDAVKTIRAKLAADAAPAPVEA